MRLIHNLDASFPETITKTILRSYTGNFVQICVDFQKYWNNAVSNDGFIIENMELSHIDLAVCEISHFSVDKIQQFC